MVSGRRWAGEREIEEERESLAGAVFFRWLWLDWRVIDLGVHQIHMFLYQRSCVYRRGVRIYYDTYYTTCFPAEIYCVAFFTGTLGYLAHE